MIIPTLEDIKRAHQRIQGYIHRTPVMGSTLLNEILGFEVFFKCENLQKAGAFKFRGASNALLSLSKMELDLGVGTHSSGNHAGALAKAAAMKGVSAHIVMPNNSRAVKKAAVEGYGAKVYYCEPTLEARETTMEEVVDKTGCTFIHPYNKFEIIAGQGTACLELMEDVPELDMIMTPVGGGGLLSGTAIAAKSLKKKIKVYAGEPKGADDAYRSFYSGTFVPSIEPNTMADGLLTSLGSLTYSVLQKYVDEVLLCEEEEIVQAMRLIWERLKIIVEPSSAVPLAALLNHQDEFAGKRIGIILSGGNVDLAELPF